MVDFVEICTICTKKAIIKAAKGIFNSDKICRSYYDFYFGVTFLEHSVCIAGKEKLDKSYSNNNNAHKCIPAHVHNCGGGCVCREVRH